MLGNVNGGKAKGGSKTPDWKVFRAMEFIPGYARLPGMDADVLLEPHHCAALADALEAGHLKNASWVIQMVTVDDTMERIHTVAEEYRKLEAGADAIA